MTTHVGLTSGFVLRALGVTLAGENSLLEEPPSLMCLCLSAHMGQGFKPDILHILGCHKAKK